MKRKHLGSKFEDFLKEDGLLESCRGTAIKFKFAHKLDKVTDSRNVSKVKVSMRSKSR